MKSVSCAIGWHVKLLICYSIPVSTGHINDSLLNLFLQLPNYCTCQLTMQICKYSNRIYTNVLLATQFRMLTDHTDVCIYRDWIYADERTKWQREREIPCTREVEREIERERKTERQRESEREKVGWHVKWSSYACICVNPVIIYTYIC